MRNDRAGILIDGADDDRLRLRCLICGESVTFRQQYGRVWAAPKFPDIASVEFFRLADEAESFRTSAGKAVFGNLEICE